MVYELFFFIGNFQRFLDSNLIIILKTAAITAAALTFFSAAGIIIAAVCCIIEKKAKSYYIIHAILMTVSGIAGTACLIVYRAVDILSQGIN